MKYHFQIDGEWVRPMEGYRLRCCDCGLVHDLNFRIVDGKVEFQAFRNNRSTGQIRSRPAHRNYTIPLEKAKRFNGNKQFPYLNKIISGAISAYKHAHGNTINERSLTKRIAGAIREGFVRLLADRYILNWLCSNRIDLSKLKGELRNALVDRIENQ